MSFYDKSDDTRSKPNVLKVKQSKVVLKKVSPFRHNDLEGGVPLVSHRSPLGPLKDAKVAKSKIQSSHFDNYADIDIPQLQKADSRCSDKLGSRRQTLNDTFTEKQWKAAMKNNMAASTNTG
jgi:hypothetical protein